MSKAEDFFLQLACDIPDSKPGKMFGSLCIKLSNGKSAAMMWKDDIVVKLPKTEMEKIQKLKGVKLFEPMEGRPMKEWLQVPFSHSSEWKGLIKKSADFVLSEKGSPLKKKK
jgi:hypothetical protein